MNEKDFYTTAFIANYVSHCCASRVNNVVKNNELQNPIDVFTTEALALAEVAWLEYLKQTKRK